MSYIIDCLQHHARQHPEAPAIGDLEHVISYAELEQRVNELAVQFRAQQYSCIGLLADNSMEWAVIDLACVQAGICCIPVPTFFSRQQVKHICDTAGVQALVGDDRMLAASGLALKNNSYVGELRLVMREIDYPGQTRIVPEVNVAKITFTSGSTGAPKGVCLSMAQIDNALRALDARVPAGTSTRHVSVLPLVTLLENIAGLYLSLVQGAQILLYPMVHIGFTGLSSVDQARFFKTLAATEAQSLILVPELLRLLMQGVSQKCLDPRGFKFVAIGGGKVNETLLQQAAALGLPVLQGYGLSECASVVALNGLDDNRPGSVGKPLQHVEVSIAADGEILVAGNLMSGYLGDQLLNDDWLATGDLGYQDADGYLYVTGRKKNLLVTAYGKNVSPEWVESVFLQNPLVSQVMVTGEGGTHLRAIVVPGRPLEAGQLEQIVEQVNQQLPAYARIGECQLTRIPFLYENGLLTANGRLRRQAINDQYA